MTIKTFSQYINEAPSHAVFTFGRFNPPTTGHEKLITKIASIDSSADYFVFASSSNDPKKNPLDYVTKVKYMRKIYPKHARNIILDKKLRNVFDVMVHLFDKGYKQATMVVGSDRVMEFEKIITKFNGVKARHGFYNFESLQVVSAGERDPDAEDVSGMSASKMRAAASSNDFDLFQKGLPSAFKDAQGLFNAVRSGMGLKESYSFRKHVKLKSVSSIRESYVDGELFQKGDYVLLDNTDEVAEIVVTGSNYVIVECNGRKVRKWLDDVKLIDIG
jgi:phosphopantetheine adenylyltransferase|tara:strand:+ start:7160 stop:7984 length:825 start_codon:yes stop_codon:yes gene_type:complete